jgi:hypothetical protein
MIEPVRRRIVLKCGAALFRIGLAVLAIMSELEDLE